MRISLVIALASALFACRGDTPSKSKPGAEPQPEAAEPQAAAAPFDVDDVASCHQCHRTVVNEYLSSMHGRTQTMHDPIFAAVLKLRIKREGPELAQQCDTCHQPRRDSQNQTQNQTPGQPVPAQTTPGSSNKGIPGLGCATCHNTQSVHPDQRGSLALVKAEGNLLLGPNDIQPGVAPHGTGPAPAHMKDGITLCLACHAELHNAQGVPLCTTGSEYEQAGANSDGKTCVSCHMREVPGPSGPVASNRKKHASHSFTGPHDAWYREDPRIIMSAMDLQLVWRGAELDLTVTNKTGHSLPSGFPGRMIEFEVIGFGDTGAPVWRAWDKDPTIHAPELVFGKSYVDADGKSVFPPYATAVARDSRLAPKEVRKITMRPPANVVHARILVWFRLMAPALTAKLDMMETPEAEPKFIHRLDAIR